MLLIHSYVRTSNDCDLDSLHDLADPLHLVVREYRKWFHSPTLQAHVPCCTASPPMLDKLMESLEHLSQTASLCRNWQCRAKVSDEPTVSRAQTFPMRGIPLRRLATSGGRRVLQRTFGALPPPGPTWPRSRRSAGTFEALVLQGRGTRTAPLGRRSSRPASAAVPRSNCAAASSQEPPKLTEKWTRCLSKIAPKMVTCL